MAYLVFKNKTVIAVAMSYSEAQALACESEVAVGASGHVKYRIVEMKSGDFIENIVENELTLAVPFHSNF